MTYSIFCLNARHSFFPIRTLTFFPIVLKRQSHQEFCAGLERLLSAKFVALQRLYAPPSHGRDPRVLVNVVPKQIFNIICIHLFFMRLFSATL